MWTLSTDKEWAHLEKAFDWVQDMKTTPQDARHHAEGDVAVHTQMVLSELAKLPDYQQLDAQSKEVLWAAALMHDIEKCSTTVLENDGRITSRGHAKKGELSVRAWLYQHTNVPFDLREQIAKLVRYHGLPLWFFEKQNPEKAILQANLEVNMQWLGLLAEADSRGRICQDQADLLYRNGLFKSYCEELGCWSQTFVFASNLGRFLYFRKEDQTPDYEPFDDTQGEVILLSGLPGTGKDTYIQKHLAGYEVLSLDDIRRRLKIDPTDAKANGRVIQEAKETAKVFLRKKQPFVFNATNISRSMREIWIDLFTSYGAKTKIIYLEVPYRQLISQNKNRAYPVPDAVLFRMLGKLEVPALWEAHEVKYVVS